MRAEVRELSTRESVNHLWHTLGLPNEALANLHLVGGDDVAAPSSFRIGHLAQSSIALSGLLAALINAVRRRQPIHTVIVDRRHCVVEFNSEKLYLINGKPPDFTGTIGGLHKTRDGHVRVHDGFPNHRDAALRMMNCPMNATSADFARRVASRRAHELETNAAETGAVIYAMRTYRDWDATAQAQSVRDFPINITKVADSEPLALPCNVHILEKCLAGVRVLEMSRVLAGPVAGRTLAAHGADVLWITSPNLPDLPVLDVDTARGKRTAQLDISQQKDEADLHALLQDANVFLQTYRPGSLASKGFDIMSLLKNRNGKPLICANLSAWGTEGPWAFRRGFDSIVQTVSGMNVSEAEHYGSGEARPMPCQALDHGAGYFLASGIMTALYRQIIEGGSYRVDVSLAGVAKYLRRLGQYEGNSAFQCKAYQSFADVPPEFTDSRNSSFGKLRYIKHSVKIEGMDVGWDEMPKPLGSDRAEWN